MRLRLELYLYTVVDSRPGPGGSRPRYTDKAQMQRPGHTGRKALATRKKKRVRNGRVTSFIAGEERECPLGFCQAYARGVKETLEDKVSPRKPYNFLEVFSGPNVPLSGEVAGKLKCILPEPRRSLVGETEIEK